MGRRLVELASSPYLSERIVGKKRNMVDTQPKYLGRCPEIKVKELGKTKNRIRNDGFRIHRKEWAEFVLELTDICPVR